MSKPQSWKVAQGSEWISHVQNHPRFPGAILRQRSCTSLPGQQRNAERVDILHQIAIAVSCAAGFDTELHGAVSNGASRQIVT
jgi:hypothetical protein